MIRIAPPRPKPPQKFYVCDGKKCPNCKWLVVNECHHTTDISHARYAEHPEENFTVRISKDFGPQLWEEIR